MELPSPAQLKLEIPLTLPAREFITSSRAAAAQILEGKDERKALIAGPCSIHDEEAALEYASRLKKLSFDISHAFFPILRVFIEKSRTRTGWKGMLYDPYLDGSNDIAHGLAASRKLFVELAERGVAAAAELLEPLAVPYFDDVIVWGIVGARTSASQPHRQMASALPFPVGFKNGIHGELDAAISGILASRSPHSYIGIDPTGRISSLLSSGNPWTHLVLRGSEHQTNYDAASIAKAVRILQTQNLDPRILIDCSHGNSGKDHRKQKTVFDSAVEQMAGGSRALRGLMLESHLFSGKQPIGPSLEYGVSITDACLGWEETEDLVREGAEKLYRSMSISSVQK